MDELRNVRADIEKNKKGATREAALLTQSEIARMKASTKIMTAKEMTEMKNTQASVRFEQQKQARDRKQRMQAMDKERAKKIPMSDIEMQQRDQGEKRITRAQMLLDE